MIQLRSLSQYNITGRGRAFVVEAPHDGPRDNYLPTLGAEVEIDGVAYRPIGVDRHLPATPIRAGERIGILVAPDA